MTPKILKQLVIVFIMARRSFVNFFAFRWMITPDIIKILYVLVLIFGNLSLLGAVIAGAVGAFFYSQATGLDTLIMVAIIVCDIIAGIIISILGNLAFRMFCEQIILFFSIHEILSSIENRGKEQDKSYRRDQSQRRQSSSQKKNEVQKVGPQ